MRFVFKLLDINNDRFLDGTDLLTVQENLEYTSEFAEELQYVVQHFIKSHLLIKDQSFILSTDLIDCGKYVDLIPRGRSCLIEEFKKKIIGKPGKYANHSVLFKRSPELLRKLQALNNQSSVSLNSYESGYLNTNQHAIIIWDSPFRN